jgi:hypothetical protein
MQVHIMYFCPRCGCQSFRPSISRIRKDSIVRLLGFQPQRCYVCKVRFYLFQPGILKTVAGAGKVPAEAELKAPRLRPGVLSQH